MSPIKPNKLKKSSEFLSYLNERNLDDLLIVNSFEEGKSLIESLRLLGFKVNFFCCYRSSDVQKKIWKLL